MKKLLTIVAGAALILGAQLANAQVQKKPGVAKAQVKRAERQDKMEEMAKAVGLSEEQKGQMADINQDATQKRKAAQLRYKTAERELAQTRREEVKKINEEKRQKMEALLSDEQKVKFKEYRQTHLEDEGPGE